jgi:hypothetical protein
MKLNHVIAVSVVATAMFFSCEKTKKSESNEKANETETETVEVGQVAVDANPLAISYPEGLTVSTLNSDATEEVQIQTQTATAGTVAISYGDDASGGLTLTTQGPGEQGVQMQGSGPGNCPVSYDDVANSTLANKAKIAANRKLIIERAEQYAKDQTARSKAADTLSALKGKDCVTPTLKRSLRRLVTINKSSMNADGWGNCYLPDFGIVEGKFPGSEDACMIGNSRFELGEISTLVDMALAFDQAMLCQAKKDALENELDVGESRDLTKSLRKALEDPDVKSRANVASAKLALSGSDTSKIYTTDLVINVFMRDESSTPITFKLVHKPADETNASYSGTMTIVYLDQRPIMDKEVTRALSLSYSKAAEKVGEIDTSRIKYDLRTSTYAKDKVKFNADGLLEFNTGGCGVETDAFAPMQLVTYDGYPELDVAKMASWTNFGKNYDEAARGFVFDVRRENGVAKGCAIAGSAGYMLPGDYNGDATPVGSFSIRKALASDLTLSPLGYWQPMLCREDTGTNPNTGRYGTKVWQQCFKKDETGAWVIDTEKTTSASGFDFVDIAAVDQGLLSLPRDPGYKPDRKTIKSTGTAGCGNAPKPMMP